MSHTKLEAALNKYGRSRFIKDAEALLIDHPKAHVVLGLLGGASVAVNPNCYRWRNTAGKKYPRMAVRYVRGIGISGISKHSGAYLFIAL